MSGLILHLGRRFQLLVGGVGLITLCLVALAFSNLFMPNGQYHFLSDAHDQARELRYTLHWASEPEPVGRSFTRDDAFAYGDLLTEVFSGGLQPIDPRRVEGQAWSEITSHASAEDSIRQYRLVSYATPKLLLDNKSLAAFDVETTLLWLRYDTSLSQILENRLETITETIRVANTRSGLTVRHVERLDSGANVAARKLTQRVLTDRLGGINYYPASASWDAFWVDFPVDEIASDFDQIRELEANSVRIFLTRHAFEDPALRAQSLDRLLILLELAEAAELKLIVTCFDLGADYTLEALPASWAHLHAILEVMAGHPAASVIDLKNEPDLDYETWGQARVELWLSTLLQLAQTSFPHFDYTIGWSSAEAAGALAEQVDIISFHDYLDPRRLAERVEAVRRLAGDKPVFLTEIGHSRWSPLPQRRAQHEKLAQQLQALVEIDGVFVWTLHDFEHVPNTVAGWRPWRKAMQAQYGLSEDSRALVSDFFATFLSATKRQTYGDIL